MIQSPRSATTASSNLGPSPSRHRGKNAFDFTFDMTGGEKVEMSTNYVAKRDDLPQAYKNRERSAVENCWSASMRPPKERRAGRRGDTQ